MIEKCDSFLAEYLPDHPSSSLLDIMYSYNMSYIQKYQDKIITDFNIIFNETIEKYVFLKLSFNDLYDFLKQRSFHSPDEYYFVKGIVLWLKYDIDNRLDNSQSLFSLINCRLCNKYNMSENKIIDTGNCTLDLIIQKVHILISILNDTRISQLMIYYELDSINSVTIPSYEKSIHKYTTTLSLCKVANDGIYDLNTNHRIFKYDFGEGNKVIYINNYVLIINFTDGKMIRYNTISNDVITCSYPIGYYFYNNRSPTVNETIDGNVILIAGRHTNGTYCDIVKIYNIKTDTWADSKCVPYCVSDQRL